MVPFAGYSMPMSYSGIIEEHKAVRNTAGVFDVSHMGEFKIHGKGAENFLQLVTVNDVKKISNGQAQYSAMCTSNGGIIDDVILYRFNEYFMMVVNAANIKDDFNWLLENSNDEVFIEDISDDLNLIAIQGPKSAALLNEILECDLSKLKYYNFIQEKYNNDTITVSRTGYTGELGFEIYGNNNSIISLWEIIFNYEAFEILPIGLGARDFIGRDALLIEKNKIHRSRISFEMLDRAVPRHNYNIIVDGNVVGKVTSGTQSPSLNKGIGIGYIQIEHSSPGTEIYIEIRSTLKPGVIINPPFYKKGTVNIIY